MKTVLVLMTSGPEAVVARVTDGHVEAEQRAPGARGLAETLPRMVAAVRGSGFDLVAAVAGPGSFTGIRAGLALAHGLALGAGVDLVAVTIGEALEAGLGAPLLVVTDAGRGRLFVEHGAHCRATTVEALLVPPDLRLADFRLAGDGAPLLGAPALNPGPADVAAAALARQAGALPPRAPLPLYVDEALVSAPREAPRPPPVADPPMADLPPVTAP